MVIVTMGKESKPSGSGRGGHPGVGRGSVRRWHLSPEEMREWPGAGRGGGEECFLAHRPEWEQPKAGVKSCVDSAPVAGHGAWRAQRSVPCAEAGAASGHRRADGGFGFYLWQWETDEGIHTAPGISEEDGRGGSPGFRVTG